RGIYLLCSGLFSGLREDPDFRFGPGESNERPAVFELQSPAIDRAHLRAGIPERAIEAGLDGRPIRRSIGDRAANHGISRDLPHQIVEGALRNEGHEARGRVDAVGAERRLREDPGPRRLSAEVRAASLQLRRDVDVSHAGPPNFRLREQVAPHPQSTTTRTFAVPTASKIASMCCRTRSEREKTAPMRSHVGPAKRDRSRASSTSRCCASSNAIPSGFHSLIPLYGAGLWDAVIIAPHAKSR